MNKPDRKDFDQYIHAISAEIEQAQVKLISAANVQMLLHYWKLGHFILYNQQRLGWGSKFIEGHPGPFGNYTLIRRATPRAT